MSEALRHRPGAPALLPPLLRLLPFACCLLASQPDSCPRRLDCTLKKRAFCPPRSSDCGPCLSGFVEDEYGRCISKTQAGRGRASIPNLEEEIDFLADTLSRQDAAHLRHSQAATPIPASEHPKDGMVMAKSSQRGRARPLAATSRPSSSTEAVKSSPVDSLHISSNDAVILGMIIVCTIAGISALVVAAVCWCRLQKEIQLAQKADYPAHNLPGPVSYDKISPGDKKLAQSAQMYHYQHQKQQMLSMEKHKEEPKLPESASSDEENEDGDFTVYECPGLAPTGEMEVKNPLFDDSSLRPPPPKLHP
ncbi:neural proliferation differentiation and control protein 1 [Eublepharis macularius]|uniref:Neural proliferation differentiation and control protein 1 n=1 Tax=Eublepharis macularius TaxID=481883 RepID=A0AA97LFV1_EUBMA|nr:neural proliferation differentiation and control protein 1 [Eublepharis macularius]